MLMQNALEETRCIDHIYRIATEITRTQPDQTQSKRANLG